MAAEDTRAARDALRALHRDVDARASALGDRHGERLVCKRGCAGCCIDGLTVFAVEAERIERAHGPLLRDGEPTRAGGCAFLGPDGACRVYAERPYVCRTQGLPLRWIESADSGEAVEQRDICALNDPGDALLGMPESDCWTIGPTEAQLRRIAAAFDPTLARIALRDLFGRRR